MAIMRVLWYAIQVLIGYNLILPFFLWIIWRIVSVRQNRAESKLESDHAIIVTAYEQTHMLPSLVASILNINYSNYVVYIVADKCDVSDLKFEDPRVIVLRPPETLASNTASHAYAVRNFIRNHERLTIIDSDNLVDRDYLVNIDMFFNRGFFAVQGVRKAKNLDTTIACLDAARDIYYHFYDGKVLFELGSSATLSGSGMSFHTTLYKEFLETNDVKGAGFDKVLQNFILQKNLRIAFCEPAVVYDEKTSKTDQLVNQRSRWINTWFKYYYLGFGLIGRSFLKASLNQFLFGVNLLRPPLFVFLLLSLVCVFINLFVSPWTALLWIAGLMVFTLGFFIALLSSDTEPKIYNSLKNIPIFIYYQIQSLLNSRTANKRSVATTHYHSEPSIQQNQVKDEN